MPVPTREIDGCRDSHASLLAAIDDLTDADVRRASRLPDWTIGHVLTHIARNADSCVRRLAGAREGVVVDQYPGGHEGRAAEIEAGAARTAADIVADVRESAAAVEAIAAALPEPAWERLTRAVSGNESPASRVMWSRWHEVEVHHVDLGLGYTTDRWPAEMVSAWLPELLDGLPQRAAPAALLAWALDRGPAPTLASWG